MHRRRGQGLGAGGRSTGGGAAAAAPPCCRSRRWRGRVPTAPWPRRSTSAAGLPLGAAATAHGLEEQAALTQLDRAGVATAKSATGDWRLCNAGAASARCEAWHVTPPTLVRTCQPGRAGAVSARAAMGASGHASRMSLSMRRDLRPRPATMWRTLTAGVSSAAAAPRAAMPRRRWPPSAWTSKNHPCTSQPLCAEDRPCANSRPCAERRPRAAPRPSRRCRP